MKLSQYFSAILLSSLSIIRVDSYLYNVVECKQTDICTGRFGSIKHDNNLGLAGFATTWTIKRNPWDDPTQRSVTIHITDIKNYVKSDFQLTVLGKTTSIPSGFTQFHQVFSDEDLFIFLENVTAVDIAFSSSTTGAAFSLFYFFDCSLNILSRNDDLVTHKGRATVEQSSLGPIDDTMSLLHDNTVGDTGACWLVVPQSDPKASVGDKIYAVVHNITVNQLNSTHILDAMHKKPIGILTNNGYKDDIYSVRSTALANVESNKIAIKTSSVFLLYTSSVEDVAFQFSLRVFDEKAQKCIKDEKFCKMSRDSQDADCTKFPPRIDVINKSDCPQLESLLRLVLQGQERTISVARSLCGGCTETIHGCKDLMPENCQSNCIMYHLQDFC